MPKPQFISTLRIRRIYSFQKFVFKNSTKVFVFALDLMNLFHAVISLLQLPTCKNFIVNWLRRFEFCWRQQQHGIFSFKSCDFVHFDLMWIIIIKKSVQLTISWVVSIFSVSFMNSLHLSKVNQFWNLRILSSIYVCISSFNWIRIQ